MYMSTLLRFRLWFFDIGHIASSLLLPIWFPVISLLICDISTQINMLVRNFDLKLSVCFFACWKWFRTKESITQSSTLCCLLLLRLYCICLQLQFWVFNLPICFYALTPFAGIEREISSLQLEVYVPFQETFLIDYVFRCLFQLFSLFVHFRKRNWWQRSRKQLKLEMRQVITCLNLFPVIIHMCISYYLMAIKGIMFYTERLNGTVPNNGHRPFLVFGKVFRFLIFWNLMQTEVILL